MNIKCYALRRSLTFILILICSYSGQSQILDYSYTHYGKEDGLPSNIIYSIIADNDGILWLGSDAGLTRFDGLHTQTYSTKDGLPTNDIFRLFCDKENRIWMTGLSNQIAYYFNGKIHSSKNDSNIAKIDIGPHCHALVEDQEGTIWIMNTKLELFKLDKKNHLTITHLAKFFDHIPETLTYQQQGDTLYLMGGQETVVYKMNGKPYLLPSNSRKIDIIGYCQIGNHSYYVNDSDKLIYKCLPSIFKTNIIGSTTTNWHLLSNHDHQLVYPNVTGISFYDTNELRKPAATFLDKYSVLNYFQDRFDNHWVATYGNGLFKINSKINKIYKNDLEETSNKFQSLYVHDHYYFLGDNNAFLTILDRRNMKIVRKVYFNLKALKNCRILKINLFEGTKLAISTDNGFYIYDYVNDKIHYSIKFGSCKNHTILNDKIVILNNDGVVEFNLANNDTSFYHLHKRFYSYLNYKGDILLGTQDGLNTFNEHILKPYVLDEPFTYRVMDMGQYDSVLILATINGGVYFIRDHKVIQKLNTDNGLSSNNCFKLLIHDNELYIGSSNGINIYNFNDHKIRSLNESDGLTSNSVNDIVIEKDTLFATTENGLSIIPIKNMVTQGKFQLFNKPTVIGKDTLWSNLTSFKTHTDLPFVLNLNALSYGNKGQITYFYRIDDEDTNFLSTTNQEIYLQFSHPGKYIVETFAKDVNNKESNILKITIEVEAYIWQTIWFRILSGLIVLGAMYLLIQFFIQRARTKEIKKRQLDQKLFKLELAAWRSKVNPHFLFNSLNSVNSLIKTSQYQKAIQFIGNFSGILRQTIENSGKLLNTIESEVQYITNYLQLEMLKRDNQFKFTITFSEEKMKTYFIPSLLIQPVIENSLKHAIREKKDGEIVVRFSLEEEYVRCEISDNGNGTANKSDLLDQNKSMGIELIEEKIRILESILHQRIFFTYNYSDSITISEAKTTFLFPILISNLYDTDHSG